MVNDDVFLICRAVNFNDLLDSLYEPAVVLCPLDSIAEVVASLFKLEFRTCSLFCNCSVLSLYLSQVALHLKV